MCRPELGLFPTYLLRDHCLMAVHLRMKVVPNCWNATVLVNLEKRINKWRHAKTVESRLNKSTWTKKLQWFYIDFYLRFADWHLTTVTSRYHLRRGYKPHTRGPSKVLCKRSKGEETQEEADNNFFHEIWVYQTIWLLDRGLRPNYWTSSAREH